MPLEYFIAGRYLKAKRKEGFISLITLLSVAGVTVGVMALVIVIAVMSGAETEFRKRILGVEPHIMVMNHSGRFDHYEKVLERIKEVEGISDATPMVFAQTMIRTSGALSGAVLRGIDPVARVSMIKGISPEELRLKLTRGNPGGELPGIILGKELAAVMGVGVGNRLVVMSPGGMITPVGHIPSMRRFRVTGVFESGMYEYDSSLAYVHMDEARKLIGMGGSISAIGIYVDKIFDAPGIKDTLVSLLDYPYYARDWVEINKSLFSALKLEKTAMFVILTLIILVAAFNIASALIMMVMEKTRDIAILKAMGATDGFIRKIFMVQGMVVGFFGTAIGTLLGVFTTILLQKYRFIDLPKAYPFSTLPVELDYTDVVVIALSALIICFVSTIYPSIKASRMDPVEALRYG